MYRVFGDLKDEKELDGAGFDYEEEEEDAMSCAITSKVMQFPSRGSAVTNSVACSIRVYNAIYGP